MTNVSVVAPEKRKPSSISKKPFEWYFRHRYVNGPTPCTSVRATTWNWFARHGPLSRSSGWVAISGAKRD